MMTCLVELKMPGDSSLGFSTGEQEIWRNRIRNELVAARGWEKNWGFLVERDAGSTEPGKATASPLNSSTMSIMQNAVSTREAQVVCNFLMQESENSSFYEEWNRNRSIPNR